MEIVITAAVLAPFALVIIAGWRADARRATRRSSFNQEV